MDSSDLDPHLIHGSLEIHESAPAPNGISISSAVFAQYISVTTAAHRHTHTHTHTQTTLHLSQLAASTLRMQIRPNNAQENRVFIITVHARLRSVTPFSLTRPTRIPDNTFPYTQSRCARTMSACPRYTAFNYRTRPRHLIYATQCTLMHLCTATLRDIHSHRSIIISKWSYM